jgi:serine/threonine protein kinase
MANRVGEQLGNYRLVSLIGTGGFAEVYLGTHIHLGTQAAIKLLHTKLATPGEVEQFRGEARTIANLIHPNIVRVLDFGVEQNIPYLVMDYAPNGSLRARLPAGTALSPLTIAPYVKQVGEALQCAHDQKLIHRDIKPENMLLGRSHEVLLSDFGIAMVSQTSSQQSTQAVVGTAAYMAPEQLQGHPRSASDQYSLGIIVYEWLTGERPFQGSFTEIAAQHLLTPPPPVRQKVPSLSPAVEQVVLTALAKDPKDRFSSVRAFATAFEQASQAAYGFSDYSTRVQPAPPATPTRPTALPPQPLLPLANAPVPLAGPDAPASRRVPSPAPLNSPNWPTSSPPQGYPLAVAPAAPWAAAAPPSPEPAATGTFSTIAPAPAIASEPPRPPARKKRRPVLLTLVSLLLVVVLAGATLAGLGLVLRQGPLAFLGIVPQITANSDYHVGSTPTGASGTVFHITGQKFSSNSAINFLLDGQPLPGAPSAQSDKDGNLSTTLPVDSNWAVGNHTLTARDASGYATRGGVSLLIVHQCQAGIPCANGAPPDTASFKLTVTIQRVDAVTGDQLGERTIVLIVTGRPYPNSGTACQARDTGQKEVDTLTGSDGVSYQNTTIWTCQGIYQNGALSYTENITLNRADYANGHSCVTQTPFVSTQLDGTFTNATTISGTYRNDGFTNTCNPGNVQDSYDGATGTWTGTITNGA